MLFFVFVCCHSIWPKIIENSTNSSTNVRVPTSPNNQLFNTSLCFWRIKRKLVPSSVFFNGFPASDAFAEKTKTTRGFYQTQIMFSEANDKISLPPWSETSLAWLSRWCGGLKSFFPDPNEQAGVSAYNSLKTVQART